MSTTRRSAAAVLTLAVAGTALAGCGTAGGPGAVVAAPSASSAACRAALAAAPRTVLDRARTADPAAGAASWGAPAIVLRCGLPPAAASRLPCLGVDGQDWVADLSGDPLVFTSFGHSPALELRVPRSYGVQDASGALVDVAAMAAALPATGRRCVGS